jgi:hypothetical protein
MNHITFSQRAWNKENVGNPPKYCHPGGGGCEIQETKTFLEILHQTEKILRIARFLSNYPKKKRTCEARLGKFSRAREENCETFVVRCRRPAKKWDRQY